MTTLYLIRHAEAEGNVFRRLQGQYDSFITPNGKKQIAALRERFADIPIDAVYASDLRRTCMTARAIYEPKALPLHKDARFRELNCGVWENLPFGYLAHIDPERNEAFSHAPQRWSVEGSEPFEIYTGRFLSALREIARQRDGQSVAIFSHGMVMRGALQCLFFPDKGDLGHSENTAVTKLLWDGREFSLEYLNDAAHLSAEISTLGKQLWWRGGDHRDFNMWYRDAEPTDGALLQRLGCPTEGKGHVRISMLAEQPSGVVVTQPQDAQTERIVYLALLSDRRGAGLSAQLLGEAVSLAHGDGKQQLCIPDEIISPAAQRLFATYGFTGGILSL